MNTDEEDIKASFERLNQITELIIGCAHKVANKLGSGFLEKCYENALAYELRNSGLVVEQQVPLPVYYDEIIVGQFAADLLVDGLVIVELKAIERLAPIHAAQCINYLAATKLSLCLLINFGSESM